MGSGTKEEKKRGQRGDMEKNDANNKKGKESVKEEGFGKVDYRKTGKRKDKDLERS